MFFRKQLQFIFFIILLLFICCQKKSENNHSLTMEFDINNFDIESNPPSAKEDSIAFHKMVTDWKAEMRK